MRLLLADPPVAAAALPGSPLDLDDLAALYAVPAPGRMWLRVNMVSTLDGAGTGADGRTGSINTEPDHVVFDLLRAICDAVVVGAGTVRTEGYSPLRLADRYAVLRAATGRAASLPLVVVTLTGQLPVKLALLQSERPVLAVTVSRSPGLAGLREALGSEQVLVAGADEVDLPVALRLLHERGLRHVLSEGGPRLLAALLATDLVDELDITCSPVVVGGSQSRIVSGPLLRRRFSPRLLVEENGTLMGRWLRAAPP